MNLCNKCGVELENEDLIKGCPKCGSKLFKFINTAPSEKEQKNENHEENDLASDSVESIRVEDYGVYILNLDQLLAGETDVFADNKGKYTIDISSMLNKTMKTKQKK